MAKKIAAAAGLIILLSIGLVLTTNLVRQKQLSTTPRPATQQLNQVASLPVTAVSEISGWRLQQVILPQDNPTATPSSSLNQAYGKTLNEWGVFKKTSQNSKVDPIFPINRLQITLTDKPQTSFTTFDEKQSLISSAGSSYDPQNKTLTILVQLKPALIKSNAQNLYLLSRKVDLLYLAKLYQLTHPGTTDADSQARANAYLDSRLGNQRILVITQPVN